MNKKWETPKLIVLVRGRPEEGVLADCKTLLMPGGDAYPGANRGACHARDRNLCPGTDCSTMGTS